MDLASDSILPILKSLADELIAMAQPHAHCIAMAANCTYQFQAVDETCAPVHIDVIFAGSLSRWLPQVELFDSTGG